MDYQRTPSNLLPPTPTPWRCSRGWRSLFLTTAWLWLALGSCGSVFAVANSSTSSSSGGGGEIDLPFFCGRRGGSGDASDNGPPTTFVHLVLHSHVDAGWTNTVKVYESMASHIVRGVLAALPSTATESSAASSTPLHQDALQRDALPAQFKARRTFTWGDVFGLVKFLEQSGDQIPTTAGLSANEPGVVGGGGGGGGGVAHNTSWRDVAVQALRAGHLALVSGGWVQEDEAATTLRESLLQMNLGQEELLLALSAQSGVVPNREENKRIAGQSEMGGGEPTAELGQSTKAPQPGEYLGLEEQWDSRNESAVNTFFPEMQARLDRLSRVQSLRPHGTRLPPSSAPRAGEALLPVRTAWQIDSFGHSSLTARVLEELGYHSAVLNRIDQHEKDRRAATASLDFWWGGERASLTRDSLASSSTGNKEPHPALLAHILPKHYATPSELHDIHASTSLPLPRMGSNTLTKWANSLASLARKQAQGPFRHSGGHVLVLFGDDVVLQEPLAARRLFDRLDLVLATIANSTGSETGSTDFSDICAGYSTPQWYFQSVRQHEAQHRGLQDRADGTSTRRRKASVGRRHNTSHSIAQVGRYSGSREIALEDFPSMGSFIASVPAGGGKGGSSHQLFNNESTTPRPLFGNQTRGRLSTSSSKALRSQSRSRRLEDASRSFTKYTGSFMPYLQNSMNAWTGFLATRPRLKQQRRLAQSDFDAAATLTAVATMNAMANAKARAGTAPQPVAPLCDRAALRPAVRVLATLSHHDAVTGTCTAAVAEDYLRLVQGARRVLQACAVSAVNNISATSSATLASDQWRGVLPQEPLYGPPAWVAQQEAAWEQRRKVSESTISGDDQRKTRALVLSAPLRSPQHGSRSKPQLAADLQRLSSKSKLRPVPNAFFSVFSLFNPTIMTRTEIFCFNLEFDDDAIAAYAPDCVTDAAPFAANASAKDTNTGAPRELPRVDFEDPTPMQGCLVPTSVSIVELPSEVPVESQLLADSSSRRTADHVDREVCMKVNRSVGLSFRSFKITVTAAAMTPHARLHDAPKQRAADRTAQNAKSMQTPWAWEVPAALVPPPDLSYVLRHSALEYLSGHSTWTGSGLYTFRTLQWPTMRILFVFSVGGLAGVAGALVLESVGALVRPFGCPIASGASPRVQVPPTYGWLLHTALSCFGMPSARFLSLELFSALAAIVLGKYCLVRTELLVAGWAMLSAFCAASAVRLACAATSPKANQRYALLPGLTGITDNVTENYCDSDDDGAGSAADDDGIFTEDEGRLHLPSAEAKVRARVAFVRSTTLASLAGGVVGGYMLVATLEAPQLLSRMLLHKLFAGWSFFPGDFCSGPHCESVDAALAMFGVVCWLPLGLILLRIVKGMDREHPPSELPPSVVRLFCVCCLRWGGYMVFVVCTLLAFLGGCVGGILLRLHCHPELQAIPMSFTASTFPEPYSTWVRGTLVSYTKTHGISAGAGLESPGSQMVSRARIYNIDGDHAWQGAGVVEIVTDVLDVDDGVDLALRFSWSNVQTGFASKFRLGSPRLSDGHVFSSVALDPSKNVESNSFPLNDAASAAVMGPKTLDSLDKAAHGHVGVVSPLHAAGVSWFDDSIELRVARQSAQIDQKGVREGLADARHTLVGSRIFAKTTQCVSSTKSMQHTMCREHHETSLLGIAAAASNPLRMFQLHRRADTEREPNFLEAPMPSDIFSSTMSGQALELLNIDIVEAPVSFGDSSFAVFRVTLRNLNSSASVVFDAGSFVSKSSGLAVVNAKIVGVNVLDRWVPPAGSDIGVGNTKLSFVFCAKCIGTLHLSVARDPQHL